MELEQIITSPVQQDQYKMNMQDVVHRLFNDYTVTWTFKCRNEDVRFTPEMIKEIREQVDRFCKLRFSDEDRAYLANNMPWLSKGYINFLKRWCPMRDEIRINEGNIQAYNNCGLAIEAHGNWVDTMMYEIPILSIVNEVYFAFKYGNGAKDIEFQRRTMEKFDKLRKGEYEIGCFSEFGMRRRLSSKMQDWLIQFITDQKIPGFVGTSNVYLARKYDSPNYRVKPVGTMAHEFIMAVGQGNPEFSPSYSNKLAMDAWTDTFGTKNGIMLGDTITTDCFLLDFNDKYANLFNGVRHDSGDPKEWGEKILAHYEKFGIDPRTKTLLFSDSLDFKKATDLYRHFCDRCKVAFGIGTYLANDTDVNPLNIVMKLTEVNGRQVAKLSDVSGKGMCRDERYVEYLRRCIDWRITHER